MTSLLPAPIRALAASFARANAWADPRDLHQEAALAALRCTRSWRPDVTPLSAYQRVAVRRALLDLVRRDHNIVSGLETHGPVDGCYVVAGYQQLDLDTPAGGDPERDLDTRRTAARIREILAGHSAAARAVLLEERLPREVARDLGIPAATVRRQTWRAREAVRERLAEMVRS